MFFIFMQKLQQVNQQELADWKATGRTFYIEIVTRILRCNGIGMLNSCGMLNDVKEMESLFGIELIRKCRNHMLNEFCVGKLGKLL